MNSDVCTNCTESTAADYCQWERFEASCPSSSEVIVVTSARYGRMKFGRCMREDHGSVGCAADVKSYVAGHCSGRRRCQLTIPDAALHAVHPCPKELMPYLEASYSCVTGKASVTTRIRHRFDRAKTTQRSTSRPGCCAATKINK